MNSSGELLAQLLGLLVLRAFFGERLQHLAEDLRDGGEAARRFLRIRAGVDRFFFAVGALDFTFGLVFFVRVGATGLRDDYLHLRRILRLRDFVRRVRVDEADDDVDEAILARLHGLVLTRDDFKRSRVHRERNAHGVETFFDALRDADFTFAREEFHGSHLAHVHAHGIRRAAELCVEIGERSGRFLDRFLVGRGRRVGHQQRLGVRCLLVHRNAHVVDHVDDVFDLLRIDDLARQMVVDLCVGRDSPVPCPSRSGASAGTGAHRQCDEAPFFLRWKSSCVRVRFAKKRTREYTDQGLRRPVKAAVPDLKSVGRLASFGRPEAVVVPAFPHMTAPHFSLWSEARLDGARDCHRIVAYSPPD